MVGWQRVGQMAKQRIGGHDVPGMRHKHTAQIGAVCGLLCINHNLRLGTVGKCQTNTVVMFSVYHIVKLGFHTANGRMAFGCVHG